jgi:hypothetical protein
MISASLASYIGANVEGCTYDPFGVDGDVFVERMPDAPHAAVCVRSTGGDPQLSKLPTDLPNVQVVVRGEPGVPTSGHARARAIYAALNCLDAIELPGEPEGAATWLVGCTARQSDPVPLGPDALDRPEWSLNFGLRTTATTTNRP